MVGLNRREASAAVGRMRVLGEVVLLHLRMWLERKSSPTNPPLLIDHDRVCLVWNHFEGSPEAVYGFMLTIISAISAAEQYQARPFHLC